MKRFISGVYWVIKNGSPWRELPKEYGNWNSVFKRFNEWNKKNIWNNMLAYFAKEADLEYVSIDGTIVRAQACAAGYKDRKRQGLGQSRGGFSSKIIALVDALGNLLKFVIVPGQKSEITEAEHLLKDTLVLG